MGLDTDLPRLVEEHETGRGVRCLLYRNRANPTVAVYGSLQAGMAFEPDDKSGLAELTTRLLIRGTRKLGSAKLADLLESVGAVVSFRNTQDNILFQARMTSPWTRRVLGILSECLTRPVFNKTDLEKEKEELLTDIRLRDEDTTRRGMRELHHLIYPHKHPYRRDRYGTVESVKGIQRGEVKEYFYETVSKAPVVVAFAGHFETGEIMDWTERSFGDRLGERDPGRAKARPKAKIKGTSREIVMAHKTQTDIVMGALASARTDPDYEPLNLLNVILGELGFMGRLGQRVRDREGLAYSCTSFLNTGVMGGNWTAVAGISPRNVVKAVKLIKDEIRRICHEPVPQEELEAAKQNQLGSALMELESTEGIARASHNLAYFHLGLDYFSKRRQLYRKISSPRLLETARRYLDPSQLSTVIAGPRARL